MTESKKITVLEKATSHYKLQISGEMKNFQIPEWDTTIYYRSVQSLRSEAEVVELTKQGKSVEALVVAILNKARHEDGTLMFSKHDKAVFLNEVDPAVILKVASALNGVEMPRIEDVEKN
tara:strand:- start:1383 stop:1742 length:360 start_codon:yes stop_codon:yes gene_type:complete